MKRGGDLVIAACVGLMLGPLLLVTALAIRLTMGGPVIFTQVRSGRYGAAFRILKFRTMRDKRFEDEEDAPRITRLGRLLRTTSMDELPQLWNIIRGDMAVIGPRPTLPEQVERYVPRQRGRLKIRPGLTGWAQVGGRNALSWPERIELDLWYVNHQSTLLDLRILFRTVGVLLRPTGITAVGGVNPGFPVTAVVPARAPRGPVLDYFPPRITDLGDETTLQLQIFRARHHPEPYHPEPYRPEPYRPEQLPGIGQSGPAGPAPLPRRRPALSTPAVAGSGPE